MTVVAVVMVIAVVMIVTIVVIAVVAEVAIVVMVPAVVVFEAAMIALPVAFEELATVIARTDPAGTLVRRPSPVSPVPTVVTAHGIPVALDPDVVWRWAHWRHDNRTGRRRRANPDADRDLRVSC